MPREILYLMGLACALTLAFTAALWAYKPRPRLLDIPVSRCAIAVGLNWFAGMCYNWITGDHHGWMFNILIDSITGAVVLYRPAGRWQAVLGASYCLQITMHAGYGLALLWSFADPGKYNDALTAVAWLQLALVGGWAGGVWYWNGFRDRLPDYRAPPSRAVRRDLATPR